MRSLCWSRLRVGSAWLLGIWFSCGLSHGEDVPPRNYAVQLSAEVQETPPRIVLRWPDEGDATGYRISRRAPDSDWLQVASLGGGVTNYTDANVQTGRRYEYQALKETPGDYRGYGYISAGIRLPVTDYRGKVILLVENSLASALDPELQRLQDDLIGDGWQVLRGNASRTDSPQAVKQLVRDTYDADPINVKALFLLGHLPVPYSGNLAPDGHDNHRGAWPADSYYADLDGEWTDSSVDSTGAEREVNWNVPGDGKFDQSTIPSPVELMVGRVDLSNLTCYANKANSRSELDLTRQYLNKDHAFRVGDLEVERRGLICDNFADKGKDPISNSAWRNFSTFFGPDKIKEVGWDGFLPEVTQNSYLWSYGSGGGTYYYSVGVGSADDFALQDLRVVFTMFMGSYFGDWNNESNFLRAALGSGDVLTTTYSGFPQTLYFPMALGEPIGYAIALTQNNATNGLYPPWNTGAGQIHIALLGDPTLRMAVVRPPTVLTESSKNGAVLSWSPSPESVAGYHVYRSARFEGPYERVTAAPIADNAFVDYPPAGSYTYMVRAVKLEESGSGTYWNLSQGIFANSSVSYPNGEKPLQLEVLRSSSGVLLRVHGDFGQKFKIYASHDLEDWSEIGDGTIDSGAFEAPLEIDSEESQTYYRTVNDK